MTDLLTRTINFTPTRKVGLERLEEFTPFTGTHYRTQRNYDLGPEDRSNVSVLSPWVRHRLVTEEEITTRVMQDFALFSTEKFIQEVFWRTYWKGWLEMRPSVWAHYESERNKIFIQYEKMHDLRERHERAIEGNTGIDCFDAWAKELVETGYLQNHARMWFASIWIFTLHIPWQVGADFFLQHLMDADAASNTLSWRWVSGLQTKGKHYLARASNIRKFTNGRFDPKGLNETAGPLPNDFAFDKPVPPAPLQPLPSGKKALLLINEDDCAAEQLDFGENDIVQIATWNLSAERSSNNIGAVATNFTVGALKNAAKQATEKFGAPASTINDGKFKIWKSIDDIVTLASEASVDIVVAPFTTQGWARGPMDQLAAKLRTQNIAFYEVRRDWDSRAWPYANKGFFAFKEKIPQLMLDAGLNIKGKR